MLTQISPSVAVELVADHARSVALSPDEDNSGYASLPLCVIDAVFSIGVRYGGVKNTIRRYCEQTGWTKDRADKFSRQNGEKSISDFLALYDEMETSDAATELFGNQQNTSTKSSIKKADACRLFAQALAGAGINDFCDINDERLSLAEVSILDIPGQRSGISFDYFRKLIGDPNAVKPDRMVIRFVADGLKVAHDSVSARRAAALVKLAAKQLELEDNRWTPARLDHAIWAYQKNVKTGAKP